MFAEIVAKILAYGTIALCCAVPSGFFLTIIYWVMRNLIYLPNVQPSLAEKAKQKKRIVTATLIETQYLPDGSEKGIYEYDYKGKTRTYVMFSEIPLEDRISLYYLRNPKKATQPPRIGLKEMPWIKCYLGTAMFVTVLVLLLCIICVERFV